MSEAVRSAKDVALALLARREHSRAELARKLARRGYAGAALTAALDELERAELLSERRFAEGYVRTRREKGFGPLRIAAELRERGLREDGFAGVLDAAARQWIERAAAVRRKRFGAAPPADRRERERQARFLAGRGFTGEQIRNVLDADRPEQT